MCFERYHQARRADVASRTFAIDLANRSLLTDFLPVQSARAAGLHLIGAVRTAAPARDARGAGAIVALASSLIPSESHQPAGLNQIALTAR